MQTKIKQWRTWETSGVIIYHSNRHSRCLVPPCNTIVVHQWEVKLFTLKTQGNQRHQSRSGKKKPSLNKKLKNKSYYMEQSPSKQHSKVTKLLNTFTTTLYATQQFTVVHRSLQIQFPAHHLATCCFFMIRTNHCRLSMSDWLFTFAVTVHTKSTSPPYTTCDTKHHYPFPLHTYIVKSRDRI